MRSLMLVLLTALLVAVGCASTGTVGPTRYVDVDRDVAFAAALEAAHAMGARIKVASDTSGMIVAELAGGEVGPGVTLNISVDSVVQGSEVQVSASEPGAGEPDAYRKQELRELEEEYLDLVEQGALAIKGRRGRRY